MRHYFSKLITQLINPPPFPSFIERIRSSLKKPYRLLHQNSIFTRNLENAQLFTAAQLPKLRPLQVSYTNRLFIIQAYQYSSAGVNSLKMSRLTQLNAQNALFDYLHFTRGIQFSDAEHVSKNSSIFLRNLLLKIDDVEHVGQSLARFFRFHPINEFEPFFESLGLKPSELSRLVPKNLIYLSDDDVLLENYHVLCNYGVPRSKIGRMYKEGLEMFRYDFGVLALKLQAYEKLGLSKPTIIKLVTCCPALLVGEIDIDFLRVIEKLKSLGVELDWIRGSLSDKRRYNWNHLLEMLHFLCAIGCNKKGLSMFIKEHSRFVFDESGKRIYILVVVLLKLGLRREEILVFFAQHLPRLTGNFMKNLWRSVQFLSEIGMEAEDVAGVVSKHAQVLGTCFCRQPKVALERLNLSAERLCELIKKDPGQFSVLTSRRSKHPTNLPQITYLKEKTAFLLKLGFVENSDEMGKALSKFRGRGDQLQERFDCLVNAGLDCHTVSEMIRLVPSVLNQSIDLIQKKLDYLLHHLGYPVESLAAFPAFLCYNLDKIKLRLSMYKWVRENGAALPTSSRKIMSSTVALSTLLACSDARFVKYVVSLNPNGLEVWNRLKNSAKN